MDERMKTLDMFYVMPCYAVLSANITIMITFFFFFFFFFVSIITATNMNSFLGTAGEQEVRRLYGSGLAMRLATERKLSVEQGTRGVVGLPSSGLMADILSGNDTKIHFEDFLGLPSNRPVHMRSENPHSAMERKLGM